MYVVPSLLFQPSLFFLPPLYIPSLPHSFPLFTPSLSFPIPSLPLPSSPPSPIPLSTSPSSLHTLFPSPFSFFLSPSSLLPPSFLPLLHQTEATIRFLKAKLRVMQEEMDRLCQENSEKVIQWKRTPCLIRTLDWLSYSPPEIMRLH